MYWRDRNLRFHGYDPLTPSQRIDDLLTEIDRDPRGSVAVLIEELLAALEDLG